MPNRLLLGIGAYFLALTYSGVLSYFDTDDMMNLYGAWTALAAQVRPAGALFYRLIFEFAGFHPLPFRLAAFALLLLNLVLLSCLFRHLGSRRPLVVAALAFGCFQGSLWMIYSSTGMIYDVLCASFLYSALLVAIQRPSWWPLVALLHLGALSAKELGATLPAILLLYSRFYRPVHPAALGGTLLLSLGFVAQRFFLPSPLLGHVAYTPVFTAARILENITVYTSLLCSHAVPFTPAAAIAFWLALFGLAALLKSRPMAFGLLFFWVAISPMLVATPRHAGYVYYMPFLGLALAAGALASQLRTATLRYLPAAQRRTGRLTLTTAFLLAVVALHLKQKQIALSRSEVPAGQAAVRQIADLNLPTLASGQRVLLLNSPGIGSAYLGLFTLSLSHRLPLLTVDELPPTLLNRQQAHNYDHVIVFERQGAQPLNSSIPVPPLIRMNDRAASLVLLADVGPLESESWRWTGPEPRLLFTSPSGPTQFVLDYLIPAVTFAQTGPIEIRLSIDGLPPSTHRLLRPGSGALCLPAPVASNKLIQVQLHIANPYVSPDDGARLGLILTRVGFESLPQILRQ